MKYFWIFTKKLINYYNYYCLNVRASTYRSQRLASERNIIETCCMRLDILQSLFGRHIEQNQTCFFAGAVSMKLNEASFRFKPVHFRKTTHSIKFSVFSE